MKAKILFVLLVLLFGCVTETPSENNEILENSEPIINETGVEEMNKDIAEEGDQVKVHYTGKLENGEVFDSSEGRDPLAFTIGAGQMIKGFDEGVRGMKLNEKKTLTLEPKDAYGEYQKDRILEVSIEELKSKGIDPTPGTVIGVNGQPVPILEANAETAKLDLNHQLAGKTLIFEVELVGLDKKS